MQEIFVIICYKFFILCLGIGKHQFKADFL